MRPQFSLVLKHELRDIFLLVLVGFVLTVVFGYTKSPEQFWIAGSFAALMWVLLWKGNAYLSEFLAHYVNWLEEPLKTFLLLATASIVYTMGSIFLLVLAYESALDVDFGNKLYNVYSAVAVTIVISLFMHGRAFLMSWKQAVLDAEVLKRENLAAKFESLKNQVNPHFLFNSLNVLTNLVYENQEMAARFIKQLSEVYRYVLDTRNRELVTCHEELAFVESYLFLQKMRFGNNLQVTIALRDANTMFPPMALQMLMENAIKHNVVSADNPLKIAVHVQNNQVVIENNLQRKAVPVEDSTGLGLDNLRARYSFLAGKEIEVRETATHFQVFLPFISAT